MNSKKRNEKAKTPEAQVKIGIAAPSFEAPPGIFPDDIPILLKEDICRWKREIDKHREYFMGKGINPFWEAYEILLSFLNIFDKVAGMKAKE
jgi:hypothetical protein